MPAHTFSPHIIYFIIVSLREHRHTFEIYIIRYLEVCDPLNRRSVFGLFKLTAEGPEVSRAFAMRAQNAILKYFARTPCVAFDLGLHAASWGSLKLIQWKAPFEANASFSPVLSPPAPFGCTGKSLVHFFEGLPPA